MKRVTFFISLFLLFLLLSTFSFAEDVIVEVIVGEQVELDVKAVTGSEIDDITGVVWESSDSTVSIVDKNNNVLGKKVGTAIITGRLNQGSTILEVTFQVVVKSVEIPMVTSVVVNTKDQSLRVGESFTVDYDVIGEPGADLSVEFTTTNSDVLNVSKEGLVDIVGVGSGYAVVRNKASGKSDLVKVTVRATVERVSVDQKALEIYMGETSQMTVTYTPVENETIFLPESEWISLDKDIVTISETGEVKGVGLGKGTIRAVSLDNDKISTVTVEVVSGVDEILVSDQSILLASDRKSYQLSVEFTPVDGLEEPFDKRLKWTSSNSSVISVSSSGLITARKSGPALITVESLDGNHKDYCNVTAKMDAVIGNTSPTLKNISFTELDERVVVGQEILLSVTVSPENADLSRVKYVVEPASYGVTFKDNGLYYYMPTVEGVARVLITNGGYNDSLVLYDETTFIAKSTLEGFKIDESIFEEKHGTNVIYIGQELELVPDLNYTSKAEPILSEIDYSSSDAKVVKVIEDMRIKGVALGEETITGVTEDSGLTDTIPIRVISNIDSIITESEAKIGINMAYAPKVDIVPIENGLYGINEVIDSEYFLKIDKIKISAEFVLAEINYTKDKIEELEVYSAANSTELQKLRVRLFEYEDIYKDESFGYCDLSLSGRRVTDRNFKTLKVAEIKDNKLYAYIVSNLELLVTTNNPDVENMILVKVLDDVSSIVVFDENGIIIVTSSETDLNEFSDEMILNNSPSSWALDAIRAANTKGLLIGDVLVDYQSPITRQECVELIMKFYNIVMNSPLIDYSGISFTDTNEVNILKANKLGIISGVGDGKFSPDSSLTREQLCVIVDQTLDAMNKRLVVLNNDSYFSDEDQISSWAKESMLKMIRDHSLISGVGNNLINPKGQTTREQSIIIINKLYDSLID